MVLSTLGVKAKQCFEDDLWKRYVARGVQLAVQHTASLVGQGEILSVSFEELLKPRKMDDRTPEQIIEGIREKINS